MKKCPKCSKTYSDATLNFCLDDGTNLVEDNSTTDEPPATVMMDFPQSTSENPTLETQATQRTWETSTVTQVPKSSGSKTWMWVLGLLGVAILVCGGGTVGLIGLGVLSGMNDAPANDNTDKNKNKNVTITKTTPKRNNNTKSDTSRKLELSDDFAGWENRLSHFQDLTSEYKDNEIHLSTKKGFYFVILTTIDYKTYNSSIKVTVRNVKERRTNLGYGLLVHSDPTSILLKDYAFLISSQRQQYRIARHTNKRERNVVSWTRSSAIKKGDQPNDLEVRVEDNKLSFYINGKFVRSIKDSTNYKEGIAGIYTSDNTPIAFSNLEYRK